MLMDVLERDLTAEDLPAVLELWDRSIGMQFPLEPFVLERCLFRDARRRPNVVARLADVGGEIVGFGYATTPLRAAASDAAGRLQAIVVDPRYRRRQIGQRLANWLIAKCWTGNSTPLVCGGGLCYLWPGVPVDSDGALDFVTSLGFRFDGISYDLRATVRTSALAGAAATNLPELGVTVAPLVADDRKSFLAFVGHWFEPEWMLDLQEFLEDGGSLADILVATASDNELVGFARIHRDRRPPIGPPLYWATRLGPDAGGLGPIGVASPWRGRGLGTAILGTALMRLAERGGRDVVIDFTDQLGFYSRLGFEPWLAYRHASLDPWRRRPQAGS